MKPIEAIIVKNQEDLELAILAIKRIRHGTEECISDQEKEFILGYLSDIEDRMLVKMDEFYE